MNRYLYYFTYCSPWLGSCFLFFLASKELPYPYSADPCIIRWMCVCVCVCVFQKFSVYTTERSFLWTFGEGQKPYMLIWFLFLYAYPQPKFQYFWSLKFSNYLLSSFIEYTTQRSVLFFWTFFRETAWIIWIFKNKSTCSNVILRPHKTIRRLQAKSTLQWPLKNNSFIYILGFTAGSYAIWLH